MQKWFVIGKETNGTNVKRRNRREWDMGGAACESLETRVLPAVDLIVSEASYKITSDPFAGSDQYQLEFDFTIKNLGTTSVDLTGAPGNLSDNVLVRIYLSQDDILDGSDQNAFSGDFNLGDGGSTVIGQNQEFDAMVSGPFTANQGFRYLIIKVDSTNKVSESNESNNAFAVDAQKPELHGQTTDIFFNPKGKGALNNTLFVRDLNTINFQGGNFGVTVTGAQQKDKFLFLKSGTGPDRIRKAGNKIKMGSQTIGTVTQVLPTQDNGFQMTWRVDFTGEVNRDALSRIMRSVGFRPSVNATGSRGLQFQVKDNLENLSNVSSRTMHIS
ncbi:MAG: hypothetical protein KDA68_03980 [Planctomycetaceae bacterium]|nr:hypothetical protein [Planctomycetaceae bacterium]